MTALKKRKATKKLSSEQRLARIAEIIEIVDNRCLAVDGPVSRTVEMMTDNEMREIYKLAIGKS